MILAVAAVRNRKAKTLRALRSLSDNSTDIGFVIVDDGSEDGTPEAIEEQFADAHLVYGDGTLYWAGAMALGLRQARARAKHDAEGVLLFNDDVEFNAGAVDRMVELAAANPGSAIVGSTLAGLTNPVATYGGLKRASRWRPLKFELVDSSRGPVECDTFNGNSVFLPMQLWDAVEGIDDYFTHVFGDLDLGLRLKRLGYKIIQIDGAVGYCPRDHVRKAWLQPGLSLQERWDRISDPRGAPLLEYVYFGRRHAPLTWPLWIVATYGKLLLAAVASAARGEPRSRQR